MFEGLSGHTPTLTRQEFTDHEMCKGPRNRYALRLFIAHMTKRIAVCNTAARALLYRQLLPKCHVGQETHYALVDGVSERVFNDVLFDSLHSGERVPYNDHCNIDYYAERKADKVWTVSGGVHDAIVIHFADDLYTLPGENENRRVATVPHIQILPVFKRLHVRDSAIVKAVEEMPYGM